MTDRGASAREQFQRSAQRIARQEIDAATARMRAVEVAHLCAVEGCGRFGAWGFGPPGYGSPARWACDEHKAAVAAQRGLGRQ